MDELEKTVLDFCNEIRDSLELRPVSKIQKGTHSGFSCPISNTILGKGKLRENHSVYTDSKGWVYIKVNEKTRLIFGGSDMVTLFIHLFDTLQGYQKYFKAEIPS